MIDLKLWLFIAVLVFLPPAVKMILNYNTYKKHRTVTLAEIDEMPEADFKAYVADLLRWLGYKQVKQASTRGNFGIDVIALNDQNERIGVQCQRSNKRIGAKEVQLAIKGQAYYKLDKVFILTNNMFTEAAQKAAKKDGIGLWNRRTLTQLLEQIADKT